MPDPAPIVLLVEDEPEVREVLRQALQDAGYGVETASSRAEAMHHLLGRPVALLITDLVLADGDGTALMRVAERRGIPVLGITGLPGTPPRNAPPGPRPPRPVLKKPFPVERLTEEAARLLAARPAPG